MTEMCTPARQGWRPPFVALRILIPLALLASTPGFGQQDVDDEPSAWNERLTVTATGQERRVAELPLPVTVLTREEIDNSLEESVVDLLRRVPGVTVLRFGDEGGSTSLFMRGSESDHVLALFDGVRLNSPYFGGYDWSQLTTAGVERIEVTKGPYSALWGADAVAGVVNVIPSRGTAGEHFRLLGEAGQDNWRRLEGGLGFGDDDWDLMASFLDRDGRGELQNSDFENRQLLVDAGYSWSDSNRVAVLYQDLDSNLGIPFLDPTTPTPRRRQDSQQELMALRFHLQPNARWNLELTPSLVERALAFRDPDDAFGFTSSDTLADTSQLRLASHHDLGSPADNDRRSASHIVSWGGEWREDEVDAGSNFGVDLAGRRIDASGLFVQDSWRASDRLTVLGGVRYDDSSDWGSQVSPRLSLGYQASQGLSLRASYGQAFRQPSVGELFFPFSGNPLLDPERSESAELGIGLELASHRLDLTAFATDTEDLIEFQFATFSFANIERVEVRGVELGWSVPVAGSLLSTLQATWLDTRDQDGLALVRRPEWGASWSLNGRLVERLRGDLAVVFVGARADVDAISFARKDVGSHVTANLGISCRIRQGLEVTARVQNLADRGYQEIDGYPAPGRRLIGGLRWSR